MEMSKIIRKISSINYKKTIYNSIKRFNSPIFFNKRIKNYLLINGRNEKPKNCKNSFDLKTDKSSKNMSRNKANCASRKNIQINKNEEQKVKKKIILKTPNHSNENSKVRNYIKKKITFQSFRSLNSKNSNRNSTDNLFLNIFKKNIIIKGKSNSNRKRETSSKDSTSKNSKKKNLKANCIKSNYTNKIYLNTNIKKVPCSKNKFLFYPKLSISLDNVLSKTIIKNNKKLQKSFERNKNSYEKGKKLKNKFSMVNLLSKKKLIKKTEADNRTNYNQIIQSPNTKNDKNPKFKRLCKYHCKKRDNKIKSENLTDIKRHFTKSNLVSNKIIYKDMNKKIFNNNPINDINNKTKYISTNNNKTSLQKLHSSKKKISNYNNLLNNSKDNSNIIFDVCFNELNDAKLFNENHSTNDKSLNIKKTDTNENKISVTPNILINKYNNYESNRVRKNVDDNSLLLDDEGFDNYCFDISNENEQNNKINGVKTNNFDVKKPKEENLKFKLMKDDIESEISISQASKIIIGNIDGYNDIIEDDIKNNQNQKKKCIVSLFNKKSNLFGNLNKIEEMSKEKNMINPNKKSSSNISSILKKESEAITFNEDHLYDSFNFTSNLDNNSSVMINHIVKDNKKLQKNSVLNINNDNFYKNERKLYEGKNNFFCNISFSTNNDKSIGDFSNNLNYSVIKNNNNFELSNNKDKNKKRNNNNNYVYSQSKKGKNENINDNCVIF